MPSIKTDVGLPRCEESTCLLGAYGHVVLIKNNLLTCYFLFMIAGFVYMLLPTRNNKEQMFQFMAYIDQ